MTDADSVLLLGNAGTGKTTLLAQLHGRLQAGGGRMRMLRAPASLAPIQAALQRLEQGLAVEHTPQSTNVEQILHAIDDGGRPVDLSLPDYAGESLADVVASRRISPVWRERIRSAGHWILLLRLSQQPVLPDVLHRPVTAAQVAAGPERDTQSAPGLPLDLWSVELLQILLCVLGARGTLLPLPRLTVALSCWDELDLPDAAVPSQVLKERAPLVSSFCAAHWARGTLNFIGLSAQGQNLHKDKEAVAFVDSGPQEMGWLVTPDGKRDPDLTCLLADL